MIKLLFSFLIFYALTVISLKAQNDKFLVGGVIGTSFANDKYESNTSSKNTDFDFSTSIVFGHFLIENLVIGSELTFNTGVSKSERNLNSKTITTDWILSPFVRYYLSELFFQLQFNAGKSTYENSGSIYFDNVLEEFYSKSNHTIIGGSLGIGYNIKLSDKIFIEPQIRYSVNRYKNKYNDRSDYTKSGLKFYGGLIYRW